MPGDKVYITTFPCEDCQMAMWSSGITEVYVFVKKQHKKRYWLIEHIYFTRYCGPSYKL